MRTEDEYKLAILGSVYIVTRCPKLFHSSKKGQAMQKIVVYEEKRYNDVWRKDNYWYTWDKRGQHHITKGGVAVTEPLSKKQLSKLMGNVPKSWVSIIRAKKKGSE